MRNRKSREADLERRFAAGLACKMDDSLLDLLCEDGFLSPDELPKEDAPGRHLALIRRAIRRGFPVPGKTEDPRAEMLLVKRLDTLRVWTDLVDEDVTLRAPPACACAPT